MQETKTDSLTRYHIHQRKDDCTVDATICEVKSCDVIEEEIKELEKLKNSKARRSALSTLYCRTCMMYDVEPLIKYPRGLEEDFKKLIRDLTVSKVKFVA